MRGNQISPDLELITKREVGDGEWEGEDVLSEHITKEDMGEGGRKGSNSMIKGSTKG